MLEFKKNTLATVADRFFLCFCSTWNIPIRGVLLLVLSTNEWRHFFHLKPHWHYNIFSVFVFWGRNQGAAVFVI